MSLLPRTLGARVALVAAALAGAAGFAACTLNPQPLPPGDDNEGQATGDYDAGRNGDTGTFNPTPEGPPSDAGGSVNDGDAGDTSDAGDAGDTGDAGDGGDAAPDAG